MLKFADEKEQMKIVIVGHVDHGKSTLVGRLFYDTGSLPDGKFEQIQAMCKKRGMQFEWSFLMDALQAERDQEITIDTSQIWFKTKKRHYVIIDAPGHKEFLKNMISGAASSEAALLIIDASEGVKEQSKRHGYLLHLLGVTQIAVAVNKMDLVGYSEERFNDIEREYREYLKGINVVPQQIIPIAARDGDNIAKRSEQMKWYKGPTIIEMLDKFKKKPEDIDLPLRLPIQDVYRFDEHKRIFAGKIESGSLKVGDTLLFSPSNKTSKVATIESWGSDKLLKKIYAGMSVGITLEEQIFVERGEIASHLEKAPILTNLFKAKIFWLHNRALEEGRRFTMKINTAEYKVDVRSIEQVISTDDLSHARTKKVEKNAVAEVVLKVRGMAALDEFSAFAKTGRFMLMDGYTVVGGGIISMEGFADQRMTDTYHGETVNQDVISHERRAMVNGHLGGVLWLFGLCSSGKTTLAMELEKRLFSKGYQVYVLDGDNMRQGISHGLEFNDKDRAEHLRRVSEVAAVMAKAGIITICACTSPYREHRRRARNIVHDNFHSVFVNTDIEECKKRDKVGLYQKAKAGELKHFPGVSCEFEHPENADIILDNTNQTILENVGILEEYVESNFVRPVKQGLVQSELGEGI